MNKLSRTVAVAATFVVCIAPLHADDAPPNAVIVTATRTAQTADETLASVTVITRADIERRQAQSVADLLRGEPGLSITNNGGAGKATQVLMRGTESDHVLVLIDGVKIGSATLGTAQFQDIPVDQIERIEIVRGPRSSLYGSEAIGGVIQIFTRKGGGPVKPYFSLGGGSHNTYDGLVGVSGGGDRGWFNVSASHFGTQGINACDGKPSPGGAGCFTIEPDKDGYRNTAGSLRGGYRFGNVVELDLNWLRGEGDNQFDGSSTNNSKTLQEVMGGKLRLTPGGPWQGTLSLGRNRDEGDNFKEGNFFSRFNTRRDTGSLQNDFAIGTTQLLTVAADYQGDRVASSTNYPVTSRNNRGFLGQYQGTFSALNIETSVRRDDNEQFGAHDTYGLAWGVAAGGGLRLTLSHGTAFKAPTFNELYFPGFGNPNLQPEESKSTEIGLRGTRAGGRWSLNAFETEVDNLIAFDASINAAANVESARLRGAEAKIGSSLADWDIDAGFAWLDPENRASGANHGKVLPRRAQQAMRIDADRRIGRMRAGATIRAEGHRYDDVANTRRLGGYTTVDLRGEHAFARNWLLQARIANLFDKNYETAAFFNQEGRSYFFTLRYQPSTAQ
ncbi:MAG: TonB-dependent vitamin B12 receptor [Gammaproteobacteria bacterium]|nr:TonB-dependent vitamin B12 receptor [Gammaproteobacteria bacterium]